MEFKTRKDGGKMPLTHAEEAKLQNYITTLNIPPSLQVRIRQIAELSSEGFSTADIQKQIKGDTNSISEYRMRLRRVGAW